jgi:hypothetical protein
VIPLQPRQPGSVRADRGIRIEVRAGDEHALGAAVDREAHDRIGHHLAAMIFADADEAIAGGIDVSVGIKTPVAGDGVRRLTRPLAIHALIGEVREVHGAPVHRVRGAAVLVHARADIETLRRDVLEHAVRRAAHDHVSAAFRRASFGPVQIVAVHGEVIEPQRACRHPRGGERRFPCPVPRHL